MAEMQPDTIMNQESSLQPPATFPIVRATGCTIPPFPSLKIVWLTHACCMIQLTVIYPMGLTVISPWDMTSIKVSEKWWLSMAFVRWEVGVQLCVWPAGGRQEQTMKCGIKSMM